MVCYCTWQSTSCILFSSIQKYEYTSISSIYEYDIWTYDQLTLPFWKGTGKKKIKTREYEEKEWKCSRSLVQMNSCTMFHVKSVSSRNVCQGCSLFKVFLLLKLRICFTTVKYKNFQILTDREQVPITCSSLRLYRWNCKVYLIKWDYPSEILKHTAIDSFVIIYCIYSEIFVKMTTRKI